MFDLRKLFAREARARRQAPQPEPDSDYHPSTPAGEGLEVEYQAIIAIQFRRMGISPTCASIEVRKFGQGPLGYDVLVGMVRLHRWERTSALRLLIGLPMLEHRVRKVVRSTWLADYSHFGGLWLHASELLHEMPGTVELRRLLLALVPASTRPDEADAAADSGAPDSR